MRVERSRYIIGIDLGTTNIAMAWHDTMAGNDSVRIFPIPQLTAPGELRSLDMLPSCCHIPDPRTLPPGSLALPWDPDSSRALGLFARDHGSLVPSRYISSAKSWLCHAGVKRRSPILPWGYPDSPAKMSPPDAATAYISHLRDAWNHDRGADKDADGNPCRFETQQVVITVPAGFDETARELTLEAARRAGIENLSLLEEPLAAFHAWLHRHKHDWREMLAPGDSILVADIGGGTSDFSLIKLSDDGVLSREAAGEHLLLGGDNIDIALARRIETDWKVHLHPAEWAGLLRQTREAKEAILGGKAGEVAITVFSGGSSVVGGMRKAVLSRDVVLDCVLNGFFPECGPESPLPEKASGIRTMNLPYAADPAVTRHLHSFLRQAGNGSIHHPDHVLFNGGVMIPAILRERVLSVLAALNPGGIPARELESCDLSLAVAQGAVCFGMSRRGLAHSVKCGTSRAYYVQTAAAGERCHICVMPRGADENIVFDCPRSFMLEANRKAEFPLFSSATRTGDSPGDVIDDDSELSEVSRLTGVIRHGKAGEHCRLPTRISCELTESGVLRLWLESLASRNKWPLSFDTRQGTRQGQQVTSTPAAMFDQEALETARTMIKESLNGKAPESLMKGLEAHFSLKRRDFPLALLRVLADETLALPPEALPNAACESAWLNLLGFCLRPGFGDPEDSIRVEKLWKLWYRGMKHPGNAQASAEWWVCWRRVASGLGAGHQKTISHELMKLLGIRGGEKPKSLPPQVSTEMWRCFGALELLNVDVKTLIGKTLLSRKNRIDDCACWVLGRLAARRLFRAPVNHSLPPETAWKWIQRLRESGGRGEEHSRQLLFALSRIAARCGDRALDLSPEQIQEVRDFLSLSGVPAHWLEHLDNAAEADSGEENAMILGDSLPLGLELLD